MLCIAVGIVMRYKINSPDLLGYVSSLTRDSAHFEQFSVGSTLSELKRATLLQDVRVYIADVKPHMPVGRVAFSTGLTSGMPHGRLQETRH